MKLQALLSASLLAALTALSAGAYAEEKAAPAAEVKAENAMKPHSHVQEKSGAPQDAKPADAVKKNAAKDKSRHYHPRDMK